MLLLNYSTGIVFMVANKTPRQYIENDRGYQVETFGDAKIVTSALTI